MPGAICSRRTRTRSTPSSRAASADTLLTLGFIFIGQAMNGIELRILGLFEAWDGLSATFTGIERLKNPVVQTPLRAAPEARGMVVAVYQGNRLGIYIG